MHWFNRAPRAYRFMDEQYVDAFFRTGTLRLSSFALFSKHTDEQRLDGNEGTVSIGYRPPGDSGDFVLMQQFVGTDAYILSTCLLPSVQVMRAFSADSGIVIHEPREFALAIAAAVPDFDHGFDGPCSYQSRRHVQRDFSSAIDAPDVPYRTAGDGTQQFDNARMGEFMYAVAKRDAYFLKHFSYVQQHEWRFVWITKGPRHDYLNVNVPDARRFCEPWSTNTNFIGFDGSGPLPPPSE